MGVLQSEMERMGRMANDENGENGEDGESRPEAGCQIGVV